MAHFVQDLRFALRQLIHHRATSTVAMLTLALGIGANASMFTLMNATLFRAAPAEAPDRLAWVTASYGQSKDPRNMSYPDYADIRDRAKSFSGLLGFSHVWLSLGGTAPERIRGLLVTGNYFDVLGVRAARGRTFRAEEDGAPGAHPVAVLSDNFWRRRFDADPAIVDKTITINGQAFTVVGVAPPAFGGVEINDDEPQADGYGRCRAAGLGELSNGSLLERLAAGNRTTCAADYAHGRQRRTGGDRAAASPGRSECGRQDQLRGLTRDWRP
jgi:hypothetical protein